MIIIFHFFFFIILILFIFFKEIYLVRLVTFWLLFFFEIFIKINHIWETGFPIG
jgi:hypothetical protein